MKPERALSFAVGVSLIAYLFSRIGLEKIMAAVLSLKPSYMAGFFAVVAATVVLKGLKWKMSLGIFDIPAGLLNATVMWVIGFSMGAITPGRIGDFVKIGYAGGKKSRSFGAVILDRLTDIFAVLLFAGLGMGIFGSAFGATKDMVIFSIAAILAAAILAVRYCRPISRILFRRMVPGKYRDSFRQGAMDFFQASKQAAVQRKKILSVALMAVLIWMIAGLQGLIIAHALGINIAYFPLLFITSIVALVELIPVTVAGLGTREAAIVFLMSILGVESEKALVYSLLNFIFGYVALAMTGYILWLKNPLKLSGK